MFTWICPKCGREVPPSYSECPACGGKESDAPVAPASPPAAVAARKSRVPAWAVVVGVALLLVALGAGVITALRSSRGAAPRQAAAPLDAPQFPDAATMKTHPIARHLELTGFRLTEDAKQKAYLQFVVINHSGAEIADLAANVKLRAVTMAHEQEPVGTFSFKVPVLGPHEAKDMKAEVATKLRVYELPDWQFLRADMEITAP